MLAYGKANGYGGQKLWGFAPLKFSDFTAIKQAIQIFGSVYVGINVPSDYPTLFGNGQPWDVSRSASEGGHAIPFIDYDEDYLYAITWGAWQAMTYAGASQNLEEAWAILPQAYIDSGKAAQDGIDVAAMESDLNALAA